MVVSIRRREGPSVPKTDRGNLVLVRPMRRSQLQTLCVFRYDRIRPKTYNRLTQITIHAAHAFDRALQAGLLWAVLVDDQKTRSPVTFQSSIF